MGSAGPRCEKDTGPMSPSNAETTELQPVVVDTDVVSYLFKRDTRAAHYEPHLLGRAPVVSFMTVAELDAWALQRNWGRRTRQRLERHLTRFTFHYPDRELCRVWAAVMTAGRRSGRPIAPADSWIAATAPSLERPTGDAQPRRLCRGSGSGHRDRARSVSARPVQQRQHCNVTSASVDAGTPGKDSAPGCRGTAPGC
jgi:predicted nucleic acid-binding protein